LGQVSSSVGSVVEKYGPIDSYPRIFVLEGEKKTPYEGAVTVGGLREFLSQFATPDSDSPPASSPPPKKPAEKKPAEKKPTEPAKWAQGDKDNLDALCGNLCVVAFVNDIAEGSAQVVLDGVLTKFERDRKFKFVWVPATEATLLTKFKVGTPPVALVYNSKRQRIAKSPAFDLETLIPLLERTLGGDAPWEGL